MARSSGSPGRSGDWLRVLSRGGFCLVGWIDDLMSGWRHSFEPGTNLFAPATVFRPTSTLHKQAVVSTCEKHVEHSTLIFFI